MGRRERGEAGQRGKSRQHSQQIGFSLRKRTIELGELGYLSLFHDAYYSSIPNQERPVFDCDFANVPEIPNPLNFNSKRV